MQAMAFATALGVDPQWIFDLRNHRDDLEEDEEREDFAADALESDDASDDDEESAPAPTQCRFGFECHGRKSGMCPHIHPASASAPTPRRK